MVATAIDPAARRLGFRVIYPDGRTHGSQDPHAPSLRLNRPDVVYRRVAAGALIGFGEAYQAGDWDSDDLPGLLERVASRAGEAQWLRSRAARSRQPRSATSTAAGHAPCENLPAAFFTHMLDETMTYSSALFDGDGGGLADAQRRKIDRVLDLAGVAEGTTLLEIGTGWGELAIMAARRGARVHTVTDTPGQRSAAEARIAAAGLGAQIHLELCGYQDVQPIVRNGYDAVVSVETIEAIAEEHWPGYFGALERNLAPGGRIVIQAITMQHEHLAATRGRYTWINKYVRPRGQIPSVTAIEHVCQQAGLEVDDGAGFGASYARTFALWRERFASNSDAVAALGFDEIFRRTWDLYLAFRQASFASGFLDVRHLVLERSTDRVEHASVRSEAVEQIRTDQLSAGEAPTSRWIDLGGRVHYADYGGPNGKPLLVFVHGIGGSVVTWAPIATALAASYRVLAVDLAGFGRSKGNGLPATLSANQELLHQFLLKVADGPVVLVAHSMGGTIAAMVAAKYPEAVCALVLINPAVPWVRDELDRRLTAARATLTHVFKTGSWQSDPGTPSRTTESVLTARLFEQYLSGARGMNWSRGPDPDMTAAAVSLASTLLRRREFAAMLSSIKVPVLWLHGEDDPAVPVAAAREYVSRWPAWRFHVALGAGHELHCEVPEWTIGHICSLVDQLGTSLDD